MDNASRLLRMVDLWQDRYRNARKGIRVTDVFESLEFQEKQRDLELEINTLETLGEMFLALVSGTDCGQGAVEQAAAASLCFARRLFHVPTLNDLPQPFGARLLEGLHDTFYLGTASHLILTNHAFRADVESVDLDALFAAFLRESISAELKVGAYNRSANNIPRDIFTVQYATVESIVKNGLGVGFWNRGKVRSNYYNVFCAGILLPMMAEVEAARLKR